MNNVIILGTAVPNAPPAKHANTRTPSAVKPYPSRVTSVSHGSIIDLSKSLHTCLQLMPIRRNPGSCGGGEG